MSDFPGMLSNRRYNPNQSSDGSDKLSAPVGAGILGGPGALGYKDALKGPGANYGGAFSSTLDKRPRFEISDAGASLNPEIMSRASYNLRALHVGKVPEEVNTSLGDLLRHPELYKNYPDLQKYRVTLKHTPGDAYQGAFNPIKKTIELNTANDSFNNLTGDELGTLLHEAQHGVQMTENREMGANTTREYLRELAKTPGALSSAFGGTKTVEPPEGIAKRAYTNYRNNLGETEAFKATADKALTTAQRTARQPHVAPAEGALWIDPKNYAWYNNPESKNTRLAKIMRGGAKALDKVDDIFPGASRAYGALKHGMKPILAAADKYNPALAIGADAIKGASNISRASSEARNTSRDANASADQQAKLQKKLYDSYKKKGDKVGLQASLKRQVAMNALGQDKPIVSNPYITQTGGGQSNLKDLVTNWMR